MKTSNAQRPTSNIERNPLVLVLILVLVLAPRLHAAPPPLDPAAELQNALRPMQEGIPEVAVVRLRNLLTSNVALPDRAEVVTKLGEALVAAGNSEEALVVLDDSLISGRAFTNFLRGQALAALARWAEALAAYQKSAGDPHAPFYAEALYGQAEAFRALDRNDEALATLRMLERDGRWKTRARLLMAELLLRKRDEAGASRIVQSIAPAALPEKKERRLLRGRIEARQNRDNAIDLYDSVLKNPTGATHSVLIASLFAIAEAHRQSHTPEAGDNFLEEFIERHPADPALPALFAKLDQLYAAAERKPSGQELRRWSNDPAQPRRALALWYLARHELRQDRREEARALFAQLRQSPPALPVFGGSVSGSGADGAGGWTQ